MAGYGNMRAIALLLTGVLVTAASAAQFGLPRLMSRRPPLASDPAAPSRLRRRLPLLPGLVSQWIGRRWGRLYVDYPRADENLSIRLMELTRTRVTQDGEGNPYPVSCG